MFEEIKKKGGSLDGGEPNDKVLIIDGLNTCLLYTSDAADDA